jgi:hypothetical protein
MKSTIRVLIVLAALTAALILGSCGGVNLLQELTTDVKTAKDMFLKVDSEEPANNAEGVNPGVSIKVVFDRALDMGTVGADTLTVSPTTGEGGAPLDISYVYNADTHSLTINHGAYFATETLYTVTVTKGVRGEDKSEVKDAVVWAFTTGLVPAGTIMINDGAAYQTVEAAVKLTMTYNAITTRMRIAAYGDGWTDDVPGWVGVDTEIDPYNDLSAGDGEKTVYIQFGFLSGIKMIASPIYHATIIRDKLQPSVDAGTLPQYLNADAPTGNLNATVSDATSGINTIAWTKVSGPGSVAFGSASSADTTVSAGANGDYTIRLTVTDKAGWSNFAELDFTSDVSAPIVNAGADFYLNKANQTKNINATTSDAGTGISTWQWTKTSGPGTVTFGATTAEDTTVSASADGAYVITLTVTDTAGNATADSVSVTRDIVLPTAPVVAGTTPTTDLRPPWTWTAGGGGNGTFRHQMDGTGGAWTTTTATSYTPAALPRGPHTLFVEETDAAGNWSLFGSFEIYISPSGITPLWGATGVARSIDVDWPQYSATTHDYIFYYKIHGVIGAFDSVPCASHFWNNTGLLTARSMYDWYYEAFNAIGVKLWTSPTYCFTTGN